MVDEIYVKPSLLFHGGTVFGRAVNDPTSLASSMLGIMINCLMGGPSFLLKMIPVKGMDSEFLFQQVSAAMDLIKSIDAKVISVICDGNRTNQSFFKKFPTVPERPWLTVDNTYLLFDFVHLIKSIRNNWLTEMTEELVFEDDGQKFTARWKDILALFNAERSSSGERTGVRGSSRLTEVAVRPKPIERQKVATCLRVFCDETCAALRTNPETKDADGTCRFIQKVVDVWKILNVRTKGKDIRHRDPREAVIESPDDPRLTQLKNEAEFFFEMRKKPGGKRMKTLTKDTATALHHTLMGLSDLTKDLLSTSHRYVMLGHQSTDPLEKEFGKLRQGSGGTYFINVQQVLEKLDIKKARLLLRLNVDPSAFHVDPGHSCELCDFQMGDKTVEILDSLPELEKSIHATVKESLVHMAGYVTKKDELSEEALIDCTTFYFEKYGKYTKDIDRGGLKIPSDKSVQWSIFSYIIFNTVRDRVCRKSLSNILYQISQIFTFSMSKKNCDTLSNIFLSNHCKESNPRSSKETSQKVLKLSEKA